MKLIFFIGLVFLSTIQQCDKRNSHQNEICKDLLESIFNEDFFYVSKPGQLNLAGIDSITILDQQNFLNKYGCNRVLNIVIDSNIINKGSKGWTGINIPTINKKVLSILNEDNVPNRIIYLNSMIKDHSNPKYRCYFILKDFKISHNKVYLHFHKVISNNGIKLTYKRIAEKWELIEKEVVKY